MIYEANECNISDIGQPMCLRNVGLWMLQLWGLESGRSPNGWIDCEWPEAPIDTLCLTIFAFPAINCLIVDQKVALKIVALNRGNDGQGGVAKRSLHWAASEGL